MTNSLLAEHAAMIEAADQLVAAVKRTPRPTMDEITRLRVRLGIAIRQHAVTEEALVFGPFTREGGLNRWPELAPVLQLMTDEKARYSELIARWTPQAIAQDWDAYALSCEERVAAVKRAIRAEEAMLYPIVLGLPSTALPNRAA